MRLVDYLTDLAHRGTPVIYSEDLVGAESLVQVPQHDPDPISTLNSILPTLGLALKSGPRDTWLIVSALTPASATTPEKPSITSANVPEPLVENVIVSASRHQLVTNGSTGLQSLSRERIDALPSLGQEPLRATQQLPGSTSGGLTARPFVRGGDSNEQLIVLDGLRLYEPFHLKDFRSPTSLINGAVIGELNYYVGGFPATYGDRMSSVVDISLREFNDKTAIELDLSTLSTSLNVSGGNADGNWLVSARRSNLDLALDALETDYGEPRFGELLLHGSHDLGTRHTLGANALVGRDKIALSTPGESTADAQYQNQYVWLRLDSMWSDSLSSRSMLSYTNVDNRRQGQIDIDDQITGTVDDQRTFRIVGVQQDWNWRRAAGPAIQTGFNLRRIDADYNYRSETAVNTALNIANAVVLSGVRNLQLDPAGGQYSLYVTSRWNWQRWYADTGIRWDAQTYTTAADDEQFSPRLSLLYQPSARSAFRLSWGRYYQAQEVNELQIDAGISEFSVAQRSEHAIATLTHRLRNRLDLRVELYRKTIRSNQPRFENLFDPLVLLPDLRPDRVRIDAQATRSHGIEVSISSDQKQPLRWWASYAWAQTIDTTVSGQIARSWDQSHTVKGGLIWQHRPWQVGLTADVHSGWPRTELVLNNVDGRVEAGPRNAQRFPLFARVDLRISRDAALGAGTLRSYLELSNALNRSNPCCTSFELDNGQLRIEERNWLPIVLTLGARWRY